MTAPDEAGRGAGELALEARLGHRFARPELLREALTHRSAADPTRGQLDSNERTPAS